MPLAAVLIKFLYLGPQKNTQCRQCMPIYSLCNIDGYHHVYLNIQVTNHHIGKTNCLFLGATIWIIHYVSYNNKISIYSVCYPLPGEAWYYCDWFWPRGFAIQFLVTQQHEMLRSTMRDLVIEFKWQLQLSYFYIFGGHKYFLRATDTPFFGLLVTSPLGFKARVSSLICAWQRDT